MVAEYETEVAQPSTAQVSYLTNDHLGSPRITTDKDGKVFSRRDFMPFGEEITSDHTVQRDINLNYGEDGIRQKFTSYERDNETDLDYAKARMFGSGFGRFTSPDPLLSSGRVTNPQTWNRYSYVLNNPIVYIDPLGLYEWSAELGGSQTDDQLLEGAGKDKAKIKAAKAIIKQRTTFRNGLQAAIDAGPRSDDPAEVARATGSYGAEFEANGVTVTFGTTTNGAAAQVGANGASLDINEDGTVRARILVTISNNAGNNINSLAEYIGHEGSHNADRQGFASYLQSQISQAGGYDNFFADPNLSQQAFNNLGYNKSIYATEVRAYEVSGLIAQGRDAITGKVSSSSYNGNEVWNRGWSAADRSVNRSLGADNQVFTSPLYRGRLRQTQFPR